MILRTLYTADDLREAVERLAEAIARDHAADLATLAAGAAPPSGAPGSAAPRPLAGRPSLALLPPAAGVQSGARAEVEPSLSLERPVLVGLLKGTFMFMADLARAVRIPVDIDFIRVRPAPPGDRQPPRVDFEYEPQHSLDGRSLVVVEDVAGTGDTLRLVIERLRAHSPRSLRVCALVKRRGYTGPKVDYVGFEVGPGWLVGYGLDDREAFRNIPGLCVLED
jgi:hypoxanthine phosphoribosyltransferase